MSAMYTILNWRRNIESSGLNTMSNKIIFLQGYRCNGAQFVMKLFKPLYDKLYIKHLAKCMMILYTVQCTLYSIRGYDREKVGRWSIENVHYCICWLQIQLTVYDVGQSFLVICWTKRRGPPKLFIYTVPTSTLYPLPSSTPHCPPASAPYSSLSLSPSSTSTSVEKSTHPTDHSLVDPSYTLRRSGPIEEDVKTQRARSLERTYL